MTESEKESKTGKIFSLLNLNKDQLDDLKQEVARSNGAIAIVIHPFYEEYDDNKPFSFDSNRYHEYYLQFRNLIEEGKSGTPLLIFEELTRIEETSNTLLPWLKGEKKVYIIPTIEGNGVPLMKNDEYADYSSHWEDMIELLSSLGVKSVTLIGSRLGINLDTFGSTECYLEFYYCIAKAYYELVNQFTTKLGSILFPNSLKDLKQHNISDNSIVIDAGTGEQIIISQIFSDKNL